MRKWKGTHTADGAEKDYTFTLSLTLYFRRRNTTQLPSREVVPPEKTTVALRKPQLVTTVAHHISINSL